MHFNTADQTATALASEAATCLCRVGLLGVWVAWTKLLDAQLGQPLSQVNRRLEILALHDTSNEATSKGVTSSHRSMSRPHVPSAADLLTQHHWYR
jgi:hypothetical protein